PPRARRRARPAPPPIERPAARPSPSRYGAYGARLTPRAEAAEAAGDPPAPGAGARPGRETRRPAPRHRRRPRRDRGAAVSAPSARRRLVLRQELGLALVAGRGSPGEGGLQPLEADVPAGGVARR